MVDVIKFSEKIISISYENKYTMQQRFENGIDISRNILCNLSLSKILLVCTGALCVGRWLCLSALWC